MEREENYKPIINLALVLLLFYCSGLFQLIPIYLFNIDIKNCSEFALNIVKIFPNLTLSIILFFIYRKDLLKDFKKFKKNFNNITDIAIKYWVLGFTLMILTNSLISALTPVSISENEQSVRSLISSTPIIAFFFICIFAPFIEEIIFRKSFKDALNNKWLFIIMSGIVFGLLHVITSLNSIYDLFYIIPYSLLGLFFALAYYETNNIFSTIFIHFLHNLLLLIINIIGIGGIILWMKKKMKNKMKKLTIITTI